MKSYFISSIRLLVFFLLSNGSLQAQVSVQPTSAQDWVISKNYFFNFLLYNNKDIIQDVFNDKNVQRVLHEREKRYIESSNCKELACFLDAFKWSAIEINTLSTHLIAAVDSKPALVQLLQEQLLPSKTYGLENLGDVKAYLKKAVFQDFHAMNYVIDVYAGGKEPNYPRIDSISFDIHRKSYLSLMDDVRQDILKDLPEMQSPYFLSMFTAVRLLEINERWDAAQLEPLISQENKLAYEALKHTDFSKYPYSLLLTLGAGPTVYNQPISPGGMLRARMAARSYFAGMAPFIVLSGGRVHPYKTPYIEAIEMKKYLTDVLSVPEEAILIDPHARHTTTNMRNTARIMLSYGFPKDKYAIVNSSKPHIDAVENMADRCLREIGHVPYVLGKRVNDVILEFKPLEDAFAIDPDEPLDP